jgi:predicted PurR-regulated permease PerM
MIDANAITNGVFLSILTFLVYRFVQDHAIKVNLAKRVVNTWIACAGFAVMSVIVQDIYSQYSHMQRQRDQLQRQLNQQQQQQQAGLQ